MRYHQVQSGEWVQPRMDNYYFKCCDCGLVHRMNFRVVKGTVRFQAFRVKSRPKRSPA